MVFATSFSIDQTTPPIGCHCHIINTRQRLASKTKVLLSIGSGTIFVHQRLKAGLAIMLCCNAKSNSSDALISRACINGSPGFPSMVFGTNRLPTKPIAKRIVPKKRNMLLLRKAKKEFFS